MDRIIGKLYNGEGIEEIDRIIGKLYNGEGIISLSSILYLYILLNILLQTIQCIHLSYLEDQRNLKIYVYNNKS